MQPRVSGQTGRAHTHTGLRLQLKLIHLPNRCCYIRYMLMNAGQNEARSEQGDVTRAFLVLNRQSFHNPEWMNVIDNYGARKHITSAPECADTEPDVITFHLPGKGISRPSQAGVSSHSWWHLDVTADLFMFMTLWSWHWKESVQIKASIMVFRLFQISVVLSISFPAQCTSLIFILNNVKNRTLDNVKNRRPHSGKDREENQFQLLSCWRINIKSYK